MRTDLPLFSSLTWHADQALVLQKDSEAVSEELGLPAFE